MFLLYKAFFVGYWIDSGKKTAYNQLKKRLKTAFQLKIVIAVFKNIKTKKKMYNYSRNIQDTIFNNQFEEIICESVIKKKLKNAVIRWFLAFIYKISHQTSLKG